MMINEQDIRIGNWFHTDLENMYGVNDDGFFQWTMVHSGLECEGSIRLEDINEIPLTEKILLEAGFEKTESLCEEQMEVYSIQVANNTSLYYDKDHEEKNWYLSHDWNNNHFMNDFWNTPDSVSKLQNLYYALTGKELNIQL